MRAKRTARMLHSHFPFALPKLDFDASESRSAHETYRQSARFQRRSNVSPPRQTATVSDLDVPDGFEGPSEVQCDVVDSAFFRVVFNDKAKLLAHLKHVCVFAHHLSDDLAITIRAAVFDKQLHQSPP